MPASVGKHRARTARKTVFMGGEHSTKPKNRDLSAACAAARTWHAHKECITNCVILIDESYVQSLTCAGGLPRQLRALSCRLNAILAVCKAALRQQLLRGSVCRRLLRCGICRVATLRLPCRRRHAEDAGRQVQVERLIRPLTARLQVSAAV